MNIHVAHWIVWSTVFAVAFFVGVRIGLRISAFALKAKLDPELLLTVLKALNKKGPR
jgi:hypothetical protein